MLPLIMGLGGSALAGAGMLGGMGALTAGALGSGLGSLMQGDDLGTAIGTGLMSYMGGKALGGLGGAGAAGANSASNLASNLPAGVAPAGYMGAGTASTAANVANMTPAATTGMSGAMNALTSNLGQTAGIAAPGLMSLGQQTGEFQSMLDDDGDIPEAAAPGRVQKTPPPGYRGGIDPEFLYFNQGGIASLPYQEGGDMDMSGAPNDKELISNAVDAIQGRSDNPEMVLGQFIARYGEDALRDLVDRVQNGEFSMNAGITEGELRGAGDGMDDMIPATLEGEQDVVLSDGEFIVPADVVSGLGNGSTNAGSKALYEMMDRVREMRTGKKAQPDQVPQGMMLPA
ncbi:MAG: hypothetical protein EBS81_11240 [Gammaproteobacteria bacterium]|nr:hypothetical protein [Gammaproteobacteria bacterium]